MLKDITLNFIKTINSAILQTRVTWKTSLFLARKKDWRTGLSNFLSSLSIMSKLLTTLKYRYKIVMVFINKWKTKRIRMTKVREEIQSPVAFHILWRKLLKITLLCYEGQSKKMPQKYCVIYIILHSRTLRLQFESCYKCTHHKN